MSEIGRVLRAAYGPQREEVVQRLHWGLRRAAARLDAGELGHAGIEAVMLGVPDLTPGAVAKLAQLADIEKGGHAWWEEAWRDEPRVPKRHTGGGRWTTDNAAAPTPQGEPEGPRGRGNPMFDDGVYRPGADNPRFIPIGGPPEMEDEEPMRGSNGPPPEFTPLQAMFPGLKDRPGIVIPLVVPDRILGFSASFDEGDVAGATMMHDYLRAQIKALDPHYDTVELLPEGGIRAMSSQARSDMNENLAMDLAVTTYRVRKDIEPLQVQTLAFLRKAVDKAYAESVKSYDAGQIRPKLSRQEAIGNRMDLIVRTALQDLFNSKDISYGLGKNITINNRDYDTTKPQKTYRRLDARLGKLCFDWTLEQKSPSKPQILGFFGADSNPFGVIIIRPSQLGRDSTYMITRPAAQQYIR